MKPIKLKFMGIHSYIEEQTLHFKDISKVFGIVGPTGAGKSTILDAICLALYNRLPRFPGKTFIDSFMNPAVSESFVSFSFELMVKGEITAYTAERSYRSKKIESANQYMVSPQNRRLIKHGENGLDEPIGADTQRLFDEQIEKLVGMNYDDFVRTVILPQNKFDEFLLLSNKDRQEALKRLFHLEEHGKVGENAWKRRRELEKDSENLLIEMEILGNPSIDQLKTLLASRTEKTSSIKRLETKRKASEIEQLALEKLATYWKTQRELEENMESLEAEGPAMAIHKEKVEKAKLVEKVHPALLEKGVYEKKLDLLKKERTAQQEASHEIKEREKTFLTQYALFQTEKKEMERNLEKHRIYIERGKYIQKAIQANKERRAGFLQTYKDLESAQKTAVKELEVIERESKTWQAKKEKWTQEKESKKKPQELKQTLEKTVNLEKEWATLVAEQEKMDRADKALRVQKTAWEASEKNLVALLEEIKANATEINPLETMIDTAERSNQKIYHIEGLKPYLQVGEPCPLCGVIHHEKDTLEEDKLDLSKEREMLETLKNLQVVKEKESLQQSAILEANKALWEKEKEKLEMEQVSLDEKMVISQKILMDFAETYHFPYLESEKLLKTWQTDELYIENLEKEMEQGVKAENIRETKRRKMQADYQKQAIEIEGILVKGKEIRYYTEQQEKELLEIFQILDMDDEKTDLEIMEASIQHKLKIMKETSGGLETEKIALEAKKETIEKALHTLQADIKTYQELFAKEEKLVNRFIKDTGHQEEDIITWYLEREQIEIFEKKLLDFERSFREVTAKLAEIRTLTQSTQADLIAETLAENKRDISTFGEEIKEASMALGFIEGSIEQEKKGLVARRYLERNQKEIETNLDMFVRLSNLLRGDSFVKFVAGYQLGYITEEASRRLLKMTGGKYTLILKDAEFLLEDALSGGIYRKPTTLSGGEKFLVSLCLALSLSSSIQLSSGAKMGFFFLDEGFGSLDELTTIDALEALFSLGEEEDILVGLITHKESIVEALPTIIFVKPALEDGSGSQIIQ